MARYLCADDYRVQGETQALWVGVAILGVLLVAFVAVTWVLVGVAIIALGALAVWIRQNNLRGHSVKVSETQFPKIHQIAKEAAKRLSMPQPDIFVEQGPTINAFAIGFIGKKSVVLNSATVEAMDYGELQFIIGHEFSHIKCGHTTLLVVTDAHRAIPLVSNLLGLLFLHWSRKAEYTCDRGGLLACRDSREAVAAMCKLAVGASLYKQLDIDSFLKQRMSLDNDLLSGISELSEDHPYLVKRIQAVQDFFESEQYRSLIKAEQVTAADRPRHTRF
jgi:Zn-dependent protease with chaperone function